MATYVIGDVQGCFDALQALLLKINYQAGTDQLWFVGDLVNRGPQSLEVLRFVQALGSQQVVVLGNHDLHLLAVAAGIRAMKTKDTLAPILAAPDGADLLQWLRSRPLLYHDPKFNCVMSHAGIAPMWDLEQAIRYADEVSAALQSASYLAFLAEMFGDTPACWSDDLTGMARLRCIVNYFTRMRFCTGTGALDFAYKGTIADHPDNLCPWFEVPTRKLLPVKILFGHWAALNGKTNTADIVALDTGCVWGRCLTALRLEDWHRFSVGCG